jgi:hypothetical protein
MDFETLVVSEHQNFLSVSNDSLFAQIWAWIDFKVEI